MAVDIERDRGVDADMERVFGAAPPRAVRTVADAGRGLAGGRDAAGPPPRRWLTIAAPVLVVLIVVLLAVRFAMTLVPATPVATRGPAPVAAPAPVAPPEAPPTDLSPDRIDPGPVLPAEPVAIAPAQTVSRPAPRPAPAPSRTEAARDDPDCFAGSHEDRCIYQEVIQADRRLRTAYDQAADIGVPTRDLVAIRRRWTRARAISLDDPDETIRRYAALASELDGLIRAERR